MSSFFELYSALKQGLLTKQDVNWNLKRGVLTKMKCMTGNRDNVSHIIRGNGSHKMLERVLLNY